MEQVDVAVIGGGQSGLAAAHALLREGRGPVVLEASDQAVGSWPHYYDSLTLFSPARYSSLPGIPFPGPADRYPHRDEVVAYLAAYAARLDADIRTSSRVDQIRAEETGFAVELADGRELAARAVVAASGSFGRPYRPEIPGLERFTGRVLHTADYRSPAGFAGQRVTVVGAGNSAVQIAAELAGVTQVTLASRHPVKFAPQRILGRDLHFWFARSGLDVAPVGRFLSSPPPQPVIDDGQYRAALDAGTPARREMFTAVEDNKVTWADGSVEEVDTILLATGYRPDLPYLSALGALDDTGAARHREGASLTHPGMEFVGLEWQRCLSSNSLRGVGRDAARAARRIAAILSGH